ncbi:MAG: class I SAM-dependent methyltransferase [Deltaproteobacteria bacterium]|nr:class I SAM-dependent methyltransferase [Deltaproteobacteria bacterium]
MPLKQDANAWTHYWSKASAKPRGCLPDLPGVAADHIQEIWLQFFASLPLGARLLDLGTGGGAVLIEAQAFRPDLRLTGVDYATVLPELNKAITLYPGTRLENLPFDDGKFEAITSQFAIEYSNVSATIQEVYRVLAFAGSYLFICHHADGVIVRDNLPRLKALREAISPAGLLYTAIQAVRQQKKSAPETWQQLARIFTATQHKHPDQSLVKELADDIARIMAGPDSLEKLLAMRQAVEMEGQRIMALEKGALTENRAKILAEALSSKQQPAHLEVVHVPGVSAPFAWRISSQPRMMAPTRLGG